VLEDEEPAAIFRRLRGLEVREEALEGLWEGVAAGIAAEPAAARAASSDAPRIRRAGLLGFGAGAAAVIVALAVGWQAGFRSRTGPWSDAGARSGTQAAAARTETDAGTATEAASSSACPESIASLALTREECLALFGTPIEAPFERIEALDLRGL
jgi:hypothetical protein